MRCKPRLESIDETLYRQGPNQANMAKKRALQSPEQILYSLEQAQIRIMANKQALESQEETM